MPYDSRLETKKHIKKVQELGSIVTEQLGIRFKNHDSSKLWPPERDLFDRKDEDAEKIHAEKSNHHIESFKNGIKDMSLIDIIEMLISWKADNKNIKKYIEEMKDKHKFSKETESVLKNTAKQLGW